MSARAIVISGSFNRRVVSAVLLVWCVVGLGVCLSIAVKCGYSVGWKLDSDVPAALGAENDNIARAIRAGRGFADPFMVPTGPTAWMPPALPGLLALLYTITSDDRQWVAWLYLVFQWSLYLGLGTALVIYAEHVGGNPLRMAVLFAIAGWAQHFPIFVFTHSQALETTAVMLVLVALNWQRYPSLQRSLCGGFAAGLASLAFPAAAIGWCLVTLWQLRRHRLWLANSLLAATLIVSPWVGRNLAKFGKLYPIKSNAGYELWQSLQLSATGTLDETVLTQHPYLYRSQQFRVYSRLGEADFLAEKQSAGLAMIWDSPLKWLTHVKNRLIAAWVWQQPWCSAESTSLWTLGVSRMWKLAVLASAVVILGRRSASDSVAVLAVALMLCILGPYVLVSYYERYAWPLFPLQLITVFHASVRIGDRQESI